MACTVQIDTTPHRSESSISHGFQRFNPSFNRTAVTPAENAWDSFFLAGNPASDDFLAERASQAQAEREAL